MFVEVKLSDQNYIDPIYKLNKKKINKIINTSNKFISRYNYNNYQLQYDYIGINNSEIVHYQNIAISE